MYPIVGLYILALAVNICCLYRIIFGKTVLDSKSVMKLGFLSVGIASFMLPFVSNDIFLYLAYGDVSNQGILTYVNGSNVQQSTFFNFVSHTWADCPNHYGPFLLSLFMVSTKIGGSLIGSLIFYKLITAFFGGIYLYYAYRLCSVIKTKKYNILALLTLTPIFWFQAIGQAHLDGIIACLVIVFIYFLYHERWLPATIMVSLIVLSKLMYGAVFIPFLVIYIGHKFFGQWKTMFFELSKSFLLCILIIAVAYAPFWEGIETFTTSIEYHENKNPTRSNVEVLSETAYYVKALWTNASEIGLSSILENYDDTLSEKKKYWNFLTPIFKLFGLLLAIWVMIGVFFVRDQKDLFKIFGKALIAAICFYSPIFHPWYFLIILPFFFLIEKKTWVYYTLLVFSFSCFHEVLFAVDPKNMLNYCIIPFSYFMIFSFYVYFWRHFMSETIQLIKSRL